MEVLPEPAVRAAEKGSGVVAASAAELALDLAVDQELGRVLARARALGTVQADLFGSECPAVAEVVPAPVQVAAAMGPLAAVPQEARGAQEAVVREVAAREALALGPAEASEDQAVRAPEPATAVLALVGAAADRARDLDLVVAGARVLGRDLEAVAAPAVQAERALESGVPEAAELPESG